MAFKFLNCPTVPQCIARAATLAYLHDVTRVGRCAGPRDIGEEREPADLCEVTAVWRSDRI